MSGDLTFHRPFASLESLGPLPTAEDPMAQRAPTAEDVLLSVEKLRCDVAANRNLDAAKFNASLERIAALERRVETLERLVRLLERVTSHEPVWLPAAPLPPGWNQPGIVMCGPIDAQGVGFAGVVRDLQSVTAGQEHA